MTVAPPPRSAAEQKAHVLDLLAAEKDAWKVQSWREENELKGRTLLRDGQWLV